MIQCRDCEFFKKSESGELAFSCDPFTNVKESDCLIKWQLLKLNQMVAGYQATLDYYKKLSPLQEKMFKVMERELDDIDESEKWKVDDEDNPDSEDDFEAEKPKF